MATRVSRFAAKWHVYAAYVQERPSWLILLIFGRFLFVRQIERWVRAFRLGQVTVAGPSRVRIANVDDALPALLKHGVYPGFELSPRDCEMIRRFAESTPCGTREESRTMFLPGDIEAVNRTREFDILGAFYFDQVNDCEPIRCLAADPLLNGLARAYLGCDPIHVRTRLWWNFPADRYRDEDLYASAQDKFHFDLNDWRTLKFFFYITDCDRRSGAHQYIGGSHRRRLLRHQFTPFNAKPLEELTAYYGHDAVTTVEGPSGMGIAEDPFVFHTGKVCQDSRRLMLEIEFGTCDRGDRYKYGELG